MKHFNSFRLNSPYNMELSTYSKHFLDFLLSTKSQVCKGPENFNHESSFGKSKHSNKKTCKILDDLHNFAYPNYGCEFVFGDLFVHPCAGRVENFHRQLCVSVVHLLDGINFHAYQVCWDFQRNRIHQRDVDIVKTRTSCAIIGDEHRKD